jgi:L-ascorbate metabolism protein UlaG (beta-lactamase superfamily)
MCVPLKTATMARFSFLRRMIFDGRGEPRPPGACPNPASWSDAAITGSCLGHSTVLMNFCGVRLITDPVFSKRVGIGIAPFILGPKRYLQPALLPREFAPPDVIVLSHAHFDHLDRPSLRKFPRDIPIVTARGTSDLLRRFRHVHELDWDQSITLAPRGESIRITALPVAHWGTRLLRDEHRGYNGYLFERADRSLCFAGDTAYTPTFARLRHRSSPIDLMLMPIGAYDPWIRVHCSPEQAVEMANQAGANYFVPTHHQTFKLSSEPMDEPAARVRAAFATEPHRLLALNVGETFHVPTSRTPETFPAGMSAESTGLSL